MDKKTKQKKKTGRPKGSNKIPMDARLIAQVEKLKGIGMTHEEIADIIGVSAVTFTKMAKDSPEFSLALRLGKAKAKAIVSETAFKMATSGRNAPMTQFWLRTQAGWKETVDVKVENKHTVVFETQVIGGSLRQSSKEIGEGDQKQIEDIIDGLIVDEVEETTDDGDE